MKNDQIARIEGFINSLEHNQMEEGQQALVLQAELFVIGGNNGICDNRGSTSCGHKNGDCTNSGNTCSGSNRGTCVNGPQGPAGA